MVAERKRIGELLLEMGAITEENMEQALKHHKQFGGKLGEIFMELGFINETTLLKVLSTQYSVPCADLTKMKLEKLTFTRLPAEIAKKYKVIPIAEKESGGRKTLFLGMWDLTNMQAIEEVEFLTSATVKPVITTMPQIDAAIAFYYDDEDWVTIPPLKEKIDTIYSEEVERLHDDDSLVERTEAEEGTVSESFMDKNVELHAMLKLLVRKGVFTDLEYDKEIKKLKDK